MRKPCCEKGRINKGAWSKQEDQKLIDYIKNHGEGCWRSLPKSAGLQRCGKSCRLRWINYLKPDIKRGNFAKDEEDLIIKLHALLGNRWSLIAGRLPGRTDNEVKNYWNSHLKKKLLNMGLDPNNHKPHHHHLPPPTPNHQLVSDDHRCRHHTAAVTTSATTSSCSGQSLVNVVDQSISCNDHDNKDTSQQPSMMDLNLELTIAAPSSPCHERENNNAAGDQVQQITFKNTPINYATTRRLSPTLLLFS